MDETNVRAVMAEMLGSETDQLSWAQHMGREVLRYEIFQPRDPDSNPYYPKNDILRGCISALRCLIDATGPKSCQSREQALLRRLAAVAVPGAENGEEMTSLLAEQKDPKIQEFVYFLTHDTVIIDRIAGGHRGTIQNDTEIDISICLMPETTADMMNAIVEEACRKFHVQLKKL